LAEAEWYYPFGLPFLAIPVGIVVLLFLASPEPHFDSELREYLNEAWKGLWSREVMTLLFATVSSFILIFGSALSFAPISMGERFGSSSLLIGAMLSLMSVTTAIVSSRLTFFARRLSERRIILIVFSLYGMALISVPFIDSFLLLTIPLVVIGFAQGINYPTVQTLISRKAPAEYRAAFMSSNGMALRLGQTLAPLLMGSALAIGGLDAPSIVGGAVAAVTFVSMFVLFEGNVRICDVANDLYRPLE
jgi:ACDE family multidrug resistance protein